MKNKLLIVGIIIGSNAWGMEPWNGNNPNNNPFGHSSSISYPPLENSGHGYSYTQEQLNYEYARGKAHGIQEGRQLGLNEAAAHKESEYPSIDNLAKNADLKQARDEAMQTMVMGMAASSTQQPVDIGNKGSSLSVPQDNQEKQRKAQEAALEVLSFLSPLGNKEFGEQVGPTLIKFSNTLNSLVQKPVAQQPTSPFWKGVDFCKTQVNEFIEQKSYTPYAVAAPVMMIAENILFKSNGLFAPILLGGIGLVQAFRKLNESKNAKRHGTRAEIEAHTRKSKLLFVQGLMHFGLGILFFWLASRARTFAQGA
jgi:hypothetical protein